jgi:RNA polymerase sigma-70 factor (ECF subfamily)
VAAITRQMPPTTGDTALDASDSELMRRTSAGDRDAFATLYQRHHAAVYRFARLMTGSGAVAEDVVQEVFLVLMRNASRYDASRATLSTYLYGVARHHTRRRLSRERRFVALADDGPADGHVMAEQTAEFERRQDLQRMRRAIVSLPSRYREVLVLCDLHDVSYADAAASIGCALGTVRSRLHRARLLLGEKMRRSEVRHSSTAQAVKECRQGVPVDHKERRQGVPVDRARCAI